MELRWIKRDGKMVLQKKEEKGTYFSGGMPCGTIFNYSWIDVPTVEEPKTERAKVTDEISAFIMLMMPYCFTAPADFDFAKKLQRIIEKIDEIRNRQ